MYIIIIIDLVLLSMHYNSIHYVVIIGMCSVIINDSVPSSVRQLVTELLHCFSFFPVSLIIYCYHCIIIIYLIKEPI